MAVNLACLDQTFVIIVKLCYCDMLPCVQIRCVNKTKRSHYLFIISDQKAKIANWSAPSLKHNKLFSAVVAYWLIVLWTLSDPHIPLTLYSSLPVKCLRSVHRNPWVDKRRATSDDIGSLLRHHDGRGVQVAADDAGHDGGVDHTQLLQTQNPCVWVDNRHRVRGRAHLAGAGGVIGAVGLSADKSVDVCIGLALRTRLDFRTTERVEGLLGKNLSGEFDRLSELPHINIWEESRW